MINQINNTNNRILNVNTRKSTIVNSYIEGPIKIEE